MDKLNDLIRYNTEALEKIKPSIPKEEYDFLKKIVDSEKPLPLRSRIMIFMISFCSGLFIGVFFLIVLGLE
jgi:hypothetical protein